MLKIFKSNKFLAAICIFLAVAAVVGVFAGFVALRRTDGNVGSSGNISGGGVTDGSCTFFKIISADSGSLCR